MLPVLVVGAFAVLCLAWIWGNPPGAAPDESEHYTRAVAAGYGHLIGSVVPTTASSRGQASGQRTFNIPAGFAPPSQFACDAFEPDQPANCADVPAPRSVSTQVVTQAGEYMPTGYLLPGLLMRFGDNPFTALTLGRLGSALLSLSLLAVAVGLLWSRTGSPLALIGLVLATTAPVIFLITEVGPNGLEIAAAIAYASALLRISRPEPTSRWAWVALGYGGVLLGATRPLGPAWIVAGILIPLVLVGSIEVSALLRLQPRAAATTAGAIVAACAVNVWWQQRNPATVVVPKRLVAAHLMDSLVHLPPLINEMYGVFGWLDTRLPISVSLAWGVATAAIAVLALIVGNTRQRITLLLTSLGIVAGGALLSAYLSLALGYGGQGVGVQGRYLMPMAVWLPLLSGEILYRQRVRLRAAPYRFLFLIVAGFAGLFQLYSWLFNARRYAVGARGPILFVVPGAWAPPGGWVIWITVAAIGCTTLVGAGALSLSRTRADRE